MLLIQIRIIQFSDFNEVDIYPPDFELFTITPAGASVALNSFKCNNSKDKTPEGLLCFYPDVHSSYYCCCGGSEKTALGASLQALIF